MRAFSAKRERRESVSGRFEMNIEREKRVTATLNLIFEVRERF